MPGQKNISSFREILSSLFMIFTLVWLTVSLPYVYESQQASQELTADTETEISSNSLGNTTEERTESGGNSLSEYIHDAHIISNYLYPGQIKYEVHPDAFYAAFHPEMDLLPPELA